MVNTEACLEVTNLRKVPRRHEFELHLSSGEAIKVLKEDVEREGIEIGSSLPGRLLKHLEQRYFYTRSREIVERLLRVRPRTAAEIRRRLLREHFPKDICDKVVSELESDGMIDDLTFAKLWIDEKKVKEGRRRIRGELLSRGIDVSIVEQALELYYDDSNELETAKHMVAKRLGRLTGLPRRVVQRRLYGFLLRRGFESGIAREAISCILDEDTWEGKDES